MQNNLQIVDAVETIDTAKTTTLPAPVELTTEQLQQVGGGLTSTTAGPHDNW
jgi:hypothetical protein